MRDFQAISFTGRIQQNALNEINQFVAVHTQRTPTVQVDFCLSSLGGDVSRAFDLYNLIKTAPVEFDMVNMGNIGSAAFYPFLGVPLEHRYALPGTTFFFHEITSKPGPMTVSELRSEVLVIQRLQNHAKDLLQHELAWSESFIENLWEKETTITAEEAVKFGIISRILPNYKMPTPVFHYSQT